VGTAATWVITPDGLGHAPTIQAGIDSAAAGDTVLVSCGTYFEHDIAMKRDIVLRSKTGVAACVTIDAQELGRVIDCHQIGASTRIEAVTLTGGVAQSGSFPDNAGGGIRLVSSHIALIDCVLQGNRSKFGGGAALYFSSPTIARCVIDDNDASGVGWAAGGGLYSELSSPLVVDCTITNNRAFADTLGDGGGYFSKTGNVTVNNCTFADNSSGAGGGGFYSFLTSISHLTDCVFERNDSRAGGAMYLEDADTDLFQCTFDQNTGDSGGAMFIAGSFPEIVTCTFTQNAAHPWAGGAIDCWESSPSIVDCTFDGNSAGIRGGAIGSAAASNLDINGSVFRGNSAGGGGAFDGGNTVVANFANCTFVSNAANQGGHLRARDSASLSLTKCILAFSTTGEAAECQSVATITLDCSDVF
jgi:hypothetical protein